VSVGEEIEDIAKKCKSQLWIGKKIVVSIVHFKGARHPIYTLESPYLWS
jgi:hypothetical protein